MTRFLSLITLVFLVCVPVWAGEYPGDNGPLVRIAIAKDIDRVTVKVSGAYEIIDPKTRTVIAKGIRFPPTNVCAVRNVLTLGGKEISSTRVRFYSPRDVSVSVKNKERRYRGFVDVCLGADGRLLVINELEMEDYIKGVLLHEVSNRWPMEALKAQAVAVRTYALYQLKMNMAHEYDVTNDIYSQVYGGRTSERYRTNLAVDQTKDVILTYQGKVFPTYFHATCGGHTEDAKELWPRQSWPPLDGVRCLYCRESPHYFWQKNLSAAEIQSKLNEKGVKAGPIEDISVTRRDKSDRILTLIITGQDGRQITISGKDFREFIGPNVIRSNNYYIVMQGAFCDFIGKGWGHGAGLCQWGAQGMADKGVSYDKILEFYYPLSVLSRIKGPDPVRAY